MAAQNPVTVRLNVVSQLVKLEAQLRDLRPGAATRLDRDAVKQIQAARNSLLNETSHIS